MGVRHKNAGHHSLWPEAFRAGRALLEEAFPDQCDPARGGEVLEGVAFVGDEHRDRAIDFMQRRPKADFTMSKYNPLVGAITQGYLIVTCKVIQCKRPSQA